MDVTQVLVRWGGGDDQALHDIITSLYGELRRIARRYLRNERDGHTLQTTALVHEAYLRLARLKDVRPESRGQFFSLAAQMMRNILVDYARHSKAAKRGSVDRTVNLDGVIATAEPRAIDLLALDEALDRLARLDLRQGRLVELRFFMGLSLKESADVLSISVATAERDWQLARAFLFDAMQRTNT